MKIAAILPPITKVGGAQHFAINLHSKIAEMGIDTTIYTNFIDNRYLSSLNEIDNIKIIIINDNMLNKIGIYTGKSLLSSIRKENFDLVMSYSFPSNINLNFLKKKCPEIKTILVWFGFLGLQIEMYRSNRALLKYFQEFHGRYIGMWNNSRRIAMKLGHPIYPLIRKMDFDAMQSVDHIWVLSNHIKNLILKSYNIEAEKVLFDAVDTKRYNPHLSGDQIRQKYNAEKIIFSTSRLVPHKCVDILIKSANLIVKKYGEKDIRFIIGSDGPEKQHLQELVKKLDLEKYVIFTGYIPYDILPNYYSACDIYTHLGVNEDSGPLTILEAMSCGKAVIATNSGGVPEVIKNGETGILVPAFDYEKTAESISLLLSNSELCKKLGKNGRKFVDENHSFGLLTKNVLQTLEQYHL